MVTYNQLTIDNQRFIQERAKSKADGVYTIRGIEYRVRNHRATHYAFMGKILQDFGNCNADLGSYDNRIPGEARRLLKSIEDE